MKPPSPIPVFLCFLLALTCVLACKKEQKLEMDTNFFMTATINGNSYKADSIIGAYYPNRVLSMSGPKGYLDIGCWRRSDSGVFDIRFPISQALNTPTAFSSNLNLLTYFDVENGESSGYSTDDVTAVPLTDSASYEITSINQADSTVSGTFTGTIHCAFYKILHVRNGSFRAHYSQQAFVNFPVGIIEKKQILSQQSR